MNRSVEELECLTYERILGDCRIERGALGCIRWLSRRGKLDSQSTTCGFAQDECDAIHIGLDESGSCGVGTPESNSDPVGIPGVELKLTEEGFIRASPGGDFAGMIPEPFGR
jgi:hypothetical protein